ncbi:conserved hypothetical protein [Rhodoferax ferrireducens T118]|uniref:DNA-binding protein n=1 Tax=Albidiferax ferrireducens (strain ATCC BAA-621 / DSM 15236 / T118) TaxID=338969 RepID=Q21WA9_ALBFT|nr:conserved hypothetical protein [Rhodoferax ferrireducens T118]
MANATQIAETQAFSDRLRRALESAGIRPSPTLVAHEFNQRYWGKSITPHAARRWLLGASIPMQDKLKVLADWLQVSPEELRYGVAAAATHDDQEGGLYTSTLNMQNREMLKRYMVLSAEDRKTVRDVVTALFLASKVKAQD